MRKREKAIATQAKSFAVHRAFYSQAYGCYRLTASQFVSTVAGGVWTGFVNAEHEDDIKVVQMVVQQVQPTNHDEWRHKLLPALIDRFGMYRGAVWFGETGIFGMRIQEGGGSSA